MTTEGIPSGQLIHWGLGGGEPFTPMPTKRDAEQVVRAMKAEVWDEGWRALYLEIAEQQRDQDHPITRRNPYRSEGI